MNLTGREKAQIQISIRPQFLRPSGILHFLQGLCCLNIYRSLIQILPLYKALALSGDANDNSRQGPPDMVLNESYNYNLGYQAHNTAFAEYLLILGTNQFFFANDALCRFGRIHVSKGLREKKGAKTTKWSVSDIILSLEALSCSIKLQYIHLPIVS